MLSQHPIILIHNLDTGRSNKRCNIGIGVRQAILRQLLASHINGNLPRGTYTSVATTFKCHRTTVKTLWERHVRGEPIVNKRNESVKGRNNNLKRKIDEKLPDINIEKGAVFAP